MNDTRPPLPDDKDTQLNEDKLVQGIIDIVDAHQLAPQQSEEKSIKLTKKVLCTLNIKADSTHSTIRRIRLFATPDDYQDSFIEVSKNIKGTLTKQIVRTSPATTKKLLEFFMELQKIRSEQIVSIDLVRAGTEQLDWQESLSSSQYYKKEIDQTYDKIHEEICKNFINQLKEYVKNQIVSLGSDTSDIKVNVIDGGCGQNPLIFKLKKAVEADSELANVKIKWLGFDFSSKNVDDCNESLKKQLLNTTEEKSDYIKPDHININLPEAEADFGAMDFDAMDIAATQEEKNNNQEIISDPSNNIHFAVGDLTNMEDLIQQENNNQHLYPGAFTIGCFSGSTTRLVLKDALQCLTVLQSLASAKIEVGIFSGWADLLFRKFQAKRIGYNSQIDTSTLSYAHPLILLNQQSLAEQINYIANRLAKHPTTLDLSLHPDPLKILNEIIKVESISLEKITHINLSFCNMNNVDPALLMQLLLKAFPNLEKVTFNHHQISAIKKFPFELSQHLKIQVQHVTNELFMMGSENFFSRLNEASITADLKGNARLNNIFELLNNLDGDVKARFSKEIDICYKILISADYLSFKNIEILEAAKKSGFMPAARVLDQVHNPMSIYEGIDVFPIGNAILNGDINLVKYFLDNDASCYSLNEMNKWNGASSSPLEFTMLVQSDALDIRKRLAIMNMLLQGKYDERDPDFTKQTYIDSAMRTAIECISDRELLIPCIKKLVENGARLNLERMEKLATKTGRPIDAEIRSLLQPPPSPKSQSAFGLFKEQEKKTDASLTIENSNLNRKK